MTIKEFEEYVNGNYREWSLEFRKRADCSKKWCLRFQTAQLVFSGITPILVGLGQVDMKLPGNVMAGIEIAALISATIVPLLTSFAKLRGYKEKFIKYRCTERRLEKELILCKAGIETYENHPDKYKSFVERVEGIIDDGLRLRDPDPEEPGQ